MLRVEGLRVELDADVGIVRALDGLTFALERGETFALVGESGCGKSMTALALMRLLPESGRVVAGRILLDPRTNEAHTAPRQAESVDLLDLTELSMRGVRGRRIGMIFQEPSTSLNPVMRVGDQIVEAIEAHTDLRGSAARAKAIDWLRRVGITEPERRIDDYPFRMSGGQKQRVMIAMTLATEPEFIVADEPTTALDVTIQKQVLDLLRQLQQEQGIGLLLITHDLAVVAGMAHRVALMYAGQVVEVATAEQFFRAPRHPYARALLQTLPETASKGQALRAISGTVPPLHERFSACRFAPRCAHAKPDCLSGPPPMVDMAQHHQVRCRYPEASATADPQPHIRIEATPQAPVSTAEVNGGTLLAVRDLRVQFPTASSSLAWFGRRSQGFEAVRGVSFSVAAGETLALVGESGCGKTTTGRAIVQLLRGSARVQGQILWRGQDLLTAEGEALTAARRQVQIIFQDPYASLNPRMRVQEILGEGLRTLRPEVSAKDARTEIESLVEQVGLRVDALNRFPHEFSGGQRQRIAIARALAVQPSLIVCDEPTSALDVSVQAQILNLLGDLQQRLGLSLLFITHNMGVVRYVAHRVAVMHQGQIVEQGDTDQILEAPTQPYTRQLLEAVPKLHG